MRIKWSEYARYQYSEQIRYIALRNPDAAEDIEGTIEKTISNFLVFPYIGRKGRYPDTFELLVKKTPLIIVYEIHEEVITILNILHAAQPLPINHQSI